MTPSNASASKGALALFRERARRSSPVRWLATGGRVCREFLGNRRERSLALQHHRDAALAWLCRAQDVTPDGGVSAGFHLKDGWLPSYPETSGYIACTFFDCAVTHRPDLEDRAWRILGWLLNKQYPDGGFPGQFGARSRGPIVFNTGQILFGLIRGAERDESRRDIVTAAARAVRWLVATMDEDGCWRRHTHMGIPHSYNARTAWALLRYHKLTGDHHAREAAIRSLSWTFSMRHPNGWFQHASFLAKQPPYLHTIAYLIRGMLESGLLLADEQYQVAAQTSAEVLRDRLLTDGALSGAYDHEWRGVGAYRCLTGEVQMAIIWAKLFEQGKGASFRDAARYATHFVAARQRLDGPDVLRGAVAGSHPIWGGYARFDYPNWAAKFLVDAVTAVQRIDGTEGS